MKGEVKSQNAVPSQNTHFFVDNIGLTIRSDLYGRQLSHIFDKPSMSFSNLIYQVYHLLYSVYPISNLTFNFWKTCYNDYKCYKCVIPGISHEKLGLTNH